MEITDFLEQDYYTEFASSTLSSLLLGNDAKNMICRSRLFKPPKKLGTYSLSCLQQSLFLYCTSLPVGPSQHLNFPSHYSHETAVRRIKHALGCQGEP